MYSRPTSRRPSGPTLSTTVMEFLCMMTLDGSRHGWRGRQAFLRRRCRATRTSSTAAFPWLDAGSSWTRSSCLLTPRTAPFQWHVWSTGTRAALAGGGSLHSPTADLGATCRSLGSHSTKELRPACGGGLHRKPHLRAGWRQDGPTCFHETQPTFDGTGPALPRPLTAGLATSTKGTPARLRGRTSVKGSDAATSRPETSGSQPRQRCGQAAGQRTAAQLLPPAQLRGEHTPTNRQLTCGAAHENARTTGRRRGATPATTDAESHGQATQEKQRAVPQWSPRRILPRRRSQWRFPAVVGAVPARWATATSGEAAHAAAGCKGA